MSTPLQGSSSGQIPWNAPEEDYDAKRMIEKYHLNPERLRTPKGATLNGVRVSAQDLRNLLENEELSDVMIMFAISKDDLEEEDHSKQNFTVVLAGVQDDKIQIGEVYNMCEPCPTACSDYDQLIDTPNSP